MKRRDNARRLKAGFLYAAFIHIAALFLISGSVHAAQAPVAAITLDEAYRMAMAANENVKIAGEGVAQAEANLDKSLSKILPNVTAEGTYTRYSEQQKSASGFTIQPDDSTRADFKITQPLYSGGREWTARRQAKLNVERSREGFDSTRERIIRSTARAYFGVLKAQKDVEIKEAALKRADERNKVAAARFRVGEVTKAAVLRAEAESAGAAAELTKARSNLTDAGNFLKRVIGADGDISVTEPPGQAPLDSDARELVKRAYASRRDYRQSQLDEKIAVEGVTLARGSFMPSLRAEGLYSWRDQHPQTTFFQRDTLSASVVLTYPIFEGGLRKAELSEANSRLRESELRRIGLKRDIEIQVTESFNNIEAIRAALESYKKQLSFSEENYNMVFQQFKFGLATTVDVIDADTALISAQRSYVNSTYDLQLAILELKYNVGVLMDEAKGYPEGKPR